MMKIMRMFVLTVFVFNGVLSYNDDGVAVQQTDFQRKRFREVREKACQASEQATSSLIRALNESTFRDTLSSRFSSWSAEELLQYVRNEFRTVEIVSGYSVDPPQSSKYFDMNVREGLNTSFFESTWDAMVRHNASFDGGKGWWSIQDDVETKLYGLKAFERRGDPRTLSETIERGIYTLLNTARLDAGSPLYGDATVVLNRTFVQNSLLLSAIDTGEWTGLCNSSSYSTTTTTTASTTTASTFIKEKLPTSWPPTGYETDCSAYNFTLGTLDCFEHLILPNTNYWNASSLSTLLIRLFEGDNTNVTSTQLYTYIEGIPAEPLVFPDSVSFMIASFPDLFGTKSGNMLRDWCANQGWILVWSLGMNLGTSYNFWTAASIRSTFHSNNRVLDPHVLSSTTCSNISSIAQQAKLEFDHFWNQINETRMNTNGSLSNITLASYWYDFVSALPSDLSIEMLSSGDCADLDRCIGVSKTSSRSCICYDY